MGKKKEVKKRIDSFIHKGPNKHPVFRKKLTFGQKAADALTSFAGSWTFIISLLIFMATWMILNIYGITKQWDPYPFILLNFVLSCLAAMQAPVILMSQNREAERDRIDFKYDYSVNRKAEREIQQLMSQVDEIKQILTKKRKN